MLPIIAKIGPFTIYSYGLMLAVAVVVCSFLLSRDAGRKMGTKPELIYDLAFWVVLGGIIGARIFFIFLNLDMFIANPLEMIMIQNGGLAFQGGLILGCLTGIWFVKKHKLPLSKMLDLTAPYLALGQAIGRIGCFLNGCCYGKEVSWGIYCPVHDAKLHPTQLYESVGLVILFFILKNYNSTSKKPGEIFFIYLFGAALLRFVNEFFRADHVELAWGLSIFQCVALGLLAISVYALTYLKNRSRT